MPLDVAKDIIIPGLVNISCSFLCDLFKTFGRRTPKKKLDRILTEIDYPEINFESPSFQRFLQKTETKIVFKNYIIYNVFKHKTKEMPLGLGRDEFINTVSSSAVEFVKNDVNRTIDLTKVRLFFCDLLLIIENDLLEGLPEDLIAIPYFIGIRLNEIEESIRAMLLANSRVNQPDYEVIRLGYIKALKGRYKKSHVYGIDWLELYSFYVFPRFQVRGMGEPSWRRPIVSWIDIFGESNTISIIGGAGFGKSLFLQNLINKYEQLNIFEADSMLPIYCNLKDYTSFSSGKANYSIEDFLVQCMIYTTGKDENEINKEYLRYFLESGRCLILFDALDEVEVDERSRINSIIVSFFSTTNRNNRVCITSRDRGFIPETPVMYQVLPIDKKQIEEYLTKMAKLGHFNKEDNKLFIEQCSPLIKSKFLSSFLILSLLVNIFKAEKELPENKISLYEKCIEYIAIKRERTQKKVNFDFKLISTILNTDVSFEVLSNLAAPNNKEIDEKAIIKALLEIYSKCYLGQNEAFNAIEEFLRFCSERTELYVKGSKDGLYKFFHRSFFEFYYAKSLLKKYKNNESLISELLKFELDSEIFELSISLLKKYDYEQYCVFLSYLFECLESNNRSRFASIDRNKAIEILSVLLQVSQEAYFIDSFYKLCFNSERLLSFRTHSDSWDFITLAITKARKPLEIYKDILKYCNYSVASIQTAFSGMPSKAN